MTELENILNSFYVYNKASGSRFFDVEAAAKFISDDLQKILKRLEFVEDKPIGIWQRGDNSGYVTWNDGEYEISKAAKELRQFIGTPTHSRGE